MKSMIKMLGIIVLVMIIGFSMTACNNDGGGGNGGDNGGTTGNGKTALSGQGANINNDMKLVIGQSGSANRSVGRSLNYDSIPMTIYLQHGGTVYEAAGYREKSTGFFSVSFEANNGNSYQFDGEIKADGSINNGIFYRKYKTGENWNVETVEVKPGVISVDGTTGDSNTDGLPASMFGLFYNSYDPDSIAICNAYNMSYYNSKTGHLGYQSMPVLSVEKINDTTYDIIFALKPITANEDTSSDDFYIISEETFVVKARFVQESGGNIKITTFISENDDEAFPLDDYNKNPGIFNGMKNDVDGPLLIRQ